MIIGILIIKITQCNGPKEAITIQMLISYKHITFTQLIKLIAELIIKVKVKLVIFRTDYRGSHEIGKLIMRNTLAGLCGTPC